ncbi:uncharacterized protein LOC123538728 [Mercenaria mercenaria]|uniref:uncharacterized protein LOC123538728 n=1 Tax=Mercenaria mercenaria TaxID=6596 RepID=UPI00234ED86E|nr:uncharacterized protein LOC123538728 [Mercenaria mercenaria]
MATLDNERYLRHILLLGEGGLLVLRGIVTREAARSGQTLEHILASNRALFHNLIQEQYIILFPSTSTVNANVQSWDMSLLMVVVKRLFMGTSGLSPAETASIQALKAYRNCIQGHPTSMSMSATDYARDRRLLETALSHLASGISADMDTEIKDMIRRTDSGHIDIQSSFEHIKELHAFKTSFLDALESKLLVLTDINCELNDIKTCLNNMDGNHAGRYDALQKQLQEIDITTGATKNDMADMKACLDNMNGNNEVRNGALQTQLQEIDITTGATKNDMADMKAQQAKTSRQVEKILKMKINDCTRSTKNALQTIIKAECDQRQKEKDAMRLLFEFIDIIQNRDDFSKEEIKKMLEQRIQWHGDLCVELVDDLLSWFTDMRNIPDTVPGIAELGCIRIPIKCSSMKGMLKHLEYMDSDESKQRLSDISCSLSKMLGFSCSLSWTIAPDSLQNVMKTLSEEFKIVIPFESKSLKGLTDMWTFFEGEEANSHLTKISETLSKIVGANVSLTASVVMDQFTKAVYERSKDNISSSIDTKAQGQEQLGNIQEKPEELLQEDGIKQHAVEMKSEEKSPKPKRKEHDSKSKKKGAVGKLKDVVSSTFSFLQFKSYRNQDDGRTTYKGTADGNNAERETTKIDISPSFEPLKDDGRTTYEGTADGNNAERGTTKKDISPSFESLKDKEPDDLKETESLLEKAEELPQEIGIKQHTVEINLEEKSPKPRRKEHDSKSGERESVINREHIECIEINYNANTQHNHFYNDQTQPDAAYTWKEVENAGAKAGELKKSLTPTRWNALGCQPESVGCLISDGIIAGTVFRVGTSFLMTAFHVISHIIKKDPKGPDNEDNFDWLQLTYDRVYPNFNESVTDKPKIVSKVSCIFYNVTLDVAVLQFDVISDLPRKMILDTSGYLKPDRVYLIGFGHPENTLKKHIDPSCKVIPSNSSEIKNAHAWLLKDGNRSYREKVDNPDLVDTGYHGYDDPQKIILSCYLEHGASGAPLLAVDNKRSVVVGFLTNSMPEFYFHLSAEDQRAFPTAYRFEYGTRMKYIYHAIREANPELAKDIFGEQ